MIRGGSCDPQELIIYDFDHLGKKNYLPPSQLMLCFGFMFKVCVVTIATMCIWLLLISWMRIALAITMVTAKLKVKMIQFPW